MGGKGKIHEHPKVNTNGFQANPQNINRHGAPRKIYTVLKKNGYSKADYTAALHELVGYEVSELKKVSTDPKAPVIAVIVAKALLKASTGGDYYKAKEILEQVIGKSAIVQNNIQVNNETQGTTIIWGGNEIKV